MSKVKLTDLLDRFSKEVSDNTLTFESPSANLTGGKFNPRMENEIQIYVTDALLKAILKSEYSKESLTEFSNELNDKLKDINSNTKKFKDLVSTIFDWDFDDITHIATAMSYNKFKINSHCISVKPKQVTLSIEFKEI